MLRPVLACTLAATLVACGGDSSDDTRTYINGYIESADTEVIAVNDDINAFLSSTCDRKTFLYQAAVVTPGNDRFDPSEWSLVFSATPDIAGTREFSGNDTDMPLRLHTAYVAEAKQNGSSCTITEEQGETFRPIDGFIEFNGYGDAEFTLLMRRELADGSLTGTTVQVQGCWLISNDRRQCQQSASTTEL